MVEKHPANGVARFSLGKALFDAGLYAEAKEHLSLALNGKPDWMVVQMLLGRCELSLGNRAAARRAFEQAHALAVEQHHEGPQAELEQLLSEFE